MNKRMLTQLTFGAAIVAGAALLTPTGPASAAPLAQQPVAAGEVAGQGLVQEVHYRYRRHHRWWWRPHRDYDGWWWRRRHHHRDRYW
jgi:hypothetical protein